LHISAPSKQPIVTSNKELLFRLTQGYPLLKRKNLRACLIVVMCSLEIVVIVCAQQIALSGRSSVIEGYNSVISKVKNE
jgi:hypothetical protein